MARIRTIKPEFWTDEKVVALSPLARLLFIGMWNFVDDEGRAEFSPTRLKMQILPADSIDISEILGEIRGEKLITVYVVDDKEFFVVPGFSKHQKVDKRSKSKHPEPPSPAKSPRVPPTDQGKDQGKELESKVVPADAGIARYEFHGSVVKLNQQDFSKWTEAYPFLDLRAELTARDAYLESGEASDEDRKKWFISTSKYLANRNAEQKRKGGSGSSPGVQTFGGVPLREV